jgi:hypothetical protein
VQCAGPYDREFVLDFLVALENLRRPIYPESAWFYALRRAHEKHTARFVSNLNGRADSSYFERQHVGYFGTTHPPVTPTTAALDTCPAPRPQFDARRNAKPTSEFVRITKWERGRRRTYSRRDLVQHAPETAKTS